MILANGTYSQYMWCLHTHICIYVCECSTVCVFVCTCSTSLIRHVHVEHSAIQGDVSEGAKAAVKLNGLINLFETNNTRPHAHGHSHAHASTADTLSDSSAHSTSLPAGPSQPANLPKRKEYVYIRCVSPIHVLLLLTAIAVYTTIDHLRSVC